MTESTLANRLAASGSKGSLNINTVRVGDLDLTQTNDDFAFVAKEKSIYEVESMFEKKVMGEKPMGVIFITETGNQRERIEGIITVLDLPKSGKYDFIA